MSLHNALNCRGVKVAFEKKKGRYFNQSSLTFYDIIDSHIYTYILTLYPHCGSGGANSTTFGRACTSAKIKQITDATIFGHPAIIAL